SRTKPSWPNRPLAQSQAPDPHSLIFAHTLRVTLEFSLSHCMKPLVSSRSLFALLVSALTVGFASSSSRSSILPLVLLTLLFSYALSLWALLLTYLSMMFYLVAMFYSSFLP